MNIFKAIGKNIYNPIHFRVVRSETTRATIKYYYKLITVLALILTIIFSVIFVPVLLAFTKLIKDEGATWYPADLILTIKNGQVSTNIPEPSKFPLPPSWQEEVKEKKLESLLVIDTKNNFTLDQFEDYQ